MNYFHYFRKENLNASFHPLVFWKQKKGWKKKMLIFYSPKNIWKSLERKISVKSEIWAFVSLFTALLKKMVVFSQFSFWPKACSYNDRISWIVCKSVIDALQNKRLSSTKNKCKIFGPLLHKEKSRILSFEATYFNILFKPYKHNKKRYGDKGSPCLNPLDGLISSLGSPFTKIE